MTTFEQSAFYAFQTALRVAGAQITYTRLGGDSPQFVVVSAIKSFVTGAGNQAGALIDYFESWDFLCMHEDLILGGDDGIQIDPIAGDTILENVSAGQKFQVIAPPGQKCFRFEGVAGVIRIHTQRIQG